MDLTRSITRGAVFYKKIVSNSVCCYKSYCSKDSSEKSPYLRRQKSSDYYDAYKNAYENSGLFQNTGTIRSQQLSNDFHNIQKRDFNLMETLSNVSTEPELAEDESLKAKQYYDMYNKMFSTISECDNKEEHDPPVDDYYEKYRKIFQQGETTFTGPEVAAKLSHTTEEGDLKMVDVGNKPDSKRFAKAVGKVYLGQKAFTLVKENKLKKGDVLTTAKIAGIMACKNTSNLIPLCHPLAISNVDFQATLNEGDSSVCIECGVHTTGKTGVEMEALTGVSVAALTVYDMCKAVSQDILISDIQLLEKTGGVSGDYNKH